MAVTPHGQAGGRRSRARASARRRRAGRRAVCLPPAPPRPAAGTGRLPHLPRPRPSRASEPPDGRPPRPPPGPVLGLHEDVGTPGQYVVEVERSLVRGGVHDLGPEVTRRAAQWLDERAVLGDQLQEFGGEGAVTLQQPLDPLGGQPVPLGQDRRATYDAPVAVGADQRHVLRAGSRNTAGQFAHRGVDDVLGHHAVRGELASRDGDQARLKPGDHVFAREFGRLIGRTGDQWTQARVHAEDVVTGERRGEYGVDVLQQIVDVTGADRRVLLAVRPVGVRGAHDPVLRAPRDDEQHALLGAQDQPGGHLDPGARDQQVHSLGRPHPQRAASARLSPHLVGPDTGRVDHRTGTYGALASGLRVLYDGAHHAAPSRTNEVTRVRLAHSAPREAAVRTRERVKRASSTWASQ